MSPSLMGHQKASWITLMVEKGRDAQIFSQLLPRPDHRYTVSGISTKGGGQDWLPGETVMVGNQAISQLSTTTSPLW
jgi:hypothetical protein